MSILGIIKKIFANKVNTNPIKYIWIVILNDNLHVKLDDESLDKLNLTEIEKNKLSEARVNAKKLKEETSKLYFEFI